MALDIKTIFDQIYAELASQLLSAVGTDSKELLVTAASYLADAKASLSAIAVAALAQENPMSWQEVKLKLIQEGKIAESAFLSVEQTVASDVQAAINGLMGSFEQLLTGVLVTLQTK